MKKNIQSSVDSNWKSYQAVAQANIQSLENLEIISYTRFNSSTRLHVGDNILVNGKLARIGTVFIDEVYGHKYSIAYPEMSLGHDEINFTIEAITPISIFPKNNNLSGFSLEQVDTNELIIDMTGEVTDLKVTPYKTLSTPNDIVDDVKNLYQTDFKGTEIVDIIGVGDSGTIIGAETITPNDGISKFTEYKMVGTNVSGTITVNGVDQIVESKIIHAPTLNLIHEAGATVDNYVYSANTYLESNISINGFDDNSGVYSFTITCAGTGVYALNFMMLGIFSDSANDDYIYPDAPYRQVYTENALRTFNVIIDTDNDTFTVNDNQYPRNGNTVLKFGNDNADSTTAWDLSDLSDLLSNYTISTFTSQTTDTNLLTVTTDGTFDSIDYTSTISTPTEQIIDIPKTITQDVGQPNWTKYQIVAKSLDGTISVDGVEQIVENIGTTPGNNIVEKYIGSLTSARLDTSVLKITATSGRTITKTFTIDDTENANGNISYGLAGWDGDSDQVSIKIYVDNVLVLNKGLQSYKSKQSIFNFDTDLNGKSEIKVVATNHRVNGSNCDGGVSFVKIKYNTMTSLETFTPQIVDTNNLNISVNGTVERIDIITYIDEPIITTIEDTDSIIDLTVSDLPYTLIQENNQTNFNNYLVTSVGLSEGAEVTVNGKVQTLEYNMEGVSSLSTTNDLYDIIRVFDYHIVAEDKVITDFNFVETNKFESNEILEIGDRLLLDNLNYAQISTIENISILSNNVANEIVFTDTTTITNNSGIDWLGYKLEATNVVGDLVVNDLVQTIEKTEEVEFINFDILFQNGVDMGDDINYQTKEIYGARVIGSSGTPGRYSMNMQEVYDRGCIELKFNVSTNNCGAIYIGRYINGEILDHSSYDFTFYNAQNVDFTFNLETKTVSYENGSIDSRFTGIADYTNINLSDIVIGISSIQALEGWTHWNIVPFTKTITTYSEVHGNFSELVISGNTESLSYVTQIFDYIQPTFNIEYQDYSRTVDENGVVTNSFNTTVDTSYVNNFPTTMKTFELPTLSVSYFDIDEEIVVGPVEKSFDSINITENKIIFDYNDETKANTNKIDFVPTGIKEIIVDTKKIKEGI